MKRKRQRPELPRDTGKPTSAPPRSRLTLHPSHFTPLLLLVAWSPAAWGQEAASAPAAAELLRTDSRTPYVHRLSLYDDQGKIIAPKDVAPKPYSPSTTCSKCHEYGTIGKGWHFNAANPAVSPGRAGEPWILTDRATGTQIPLSYRRWPALVEDSMKDQPAGGPPRIAAPEALGLSPWPFTLAFGRQSPGGGVGESHPGDKSMRWAIAGGLEVDCMICHAETAYDGDERAKQIGLENLKWAPAAAMGLAVIRGSTVKVPDDFDPEAQANPDFPQQALPTVVYDKTKFDPDDRVLFSIARKPPNERCWFCHSSRRVGADSPQPWQVDSDVHVAAGMNCSDCHRHGVDHATVRGYMGEAGDYGRPEAASLTCQGCHLGEGSGASGLPDPSSMGGRLGAPRPRHAGLPALHFEKLSCTACHAGPYPTGETHRVQTSMAHKLGIASKEPRGDDLPYIVEPVFARGPDGRIAPHRLLWPAYWGRMQGQTITPLPVEVVSKAGKGILSAPKPGAAASLTGDQIAKVLTALAGQAGGAASRPASAQAAPVEPVYVAGGKVYSLGPGAAVQPKDHPAAQPYAWPISHDVRPASQSLGAGGCTDCHRAGSPFLFGRVEVAGPAQVAPAESRAMYEFEGLSPALQRAWGASYQFRPWFKVVGFIAAALLAAVLILYGFAGLSALLKRVHKASFRGPEAK